MIVSSWFYYNFFRKQTRMKARPTSPSDGEDETDFQGVSSESSGEKRLPVSWFWCKWEL